MKEAAKFHRDNPCTKVELWNCFFDQKTRRFVARPLVDAKRLIGDNAPKYLRREEYMREFLRDGIDWYELTESGRAWLHKGIVRYLELHPERKSEAGYIPSQPGAVQAVKPPATVRRRSR